MKLIGNAVLHVNVFNKLLFSLIFFLLGQTFPAFPQPGVSITDNVTKEKEKFSRTLTNHSNDPSMAATLALHFDAEVERLHKAIRKNYHLSVLDKEKAERSLIFFIQELSSTTSRDGSCMYNIPGHLQAYDQVLRSVLQRTPLIPILQKFDAQRTQMMASAFTQYPEHNIIEDVAVYKRVVSSPEYILSFLENKPNFRFADSLLIAAAAFDPARIIFYLNKGKPQLQQKIRSMDHLYLKQIAGLSDDKLAPVVLPFITQVADRTMIRDSILEQRTNVTSYFRLLVNTLLDGVRKGNNNSTFQQPLRNGIRQKAQAFYVNAVNELHNSADAIRFASVKDLRPEDLYYVITSSGDELYTSSYLGLYKRLMEHFKNGVADSLIDLVHEDNMHVFIRLAANYNVLSDFLQKLTAERKALILHRFITGVEGSDEQALEKAMDIADAFTGLANDTATKEMIGQELQLNLKRCMVTKNYLGVRLYRILYDMLELAGQEDGMKRIWATLGDYETLKLPSLKNDKGEITELVLFYGDEDGVASFNNFLRFYSNDKKWEIRKNENWISIHSKTGQPLVLYANRPLDIEEGLDLRAQDSLMIYLRGQASSPTLLVHRGHSYHLDKTLRRMSGSVKLAILGSCGSYNRSISIATINPDVQVIGSRKTGSKSINDPIIETINETLIAGNDLYWPAIWTELRNRFKKDPLSLSLFNEYFPPSHNLGLFVLKMFNHYCSGN